MNTIYFSLSLLLTITLFSNSAIALDKGEIYECDKFAAHPFDPDRVVSGVSWDKIHTKNAVYSCQNDLMKDPNNSRIQYQYARVLQKSGECEKAYELYDKSIRSGYDFGLYSVALLYSKNNGDKCHIKYSRETIEKIIDSYTKKNNSQSKRTSAFLCLLYATFLSERKEGFMYCKFSAESGNAESMYNLAVIFDAKNDWNGFNNRANSRKWIHKALEAGSESAKIHLEKLKISDSERNRNNQYWKRRENAETTRGGFSRR